MRRFEDRGAYLEAPGPVRLRRYRPDKLPNAAECVDCLIIINDDRDGVPRARLAMSNGASWDFIACAHEVEHVAVPQPSTAVTVQPVRPAEIDLTPMVRAAVEAALPAMLPQPVKVIEHRSESPLAGLAQLDQLRDDIGTLARANIEIGEHLPLIARQLAEVMARVEFIEQNALARAQLEVG